MNVYVKSALLGATSGLRTSAGPFAARWSASGSLPTGAAMALGSEMVADKLPFIGNRTRVGPLLGRASAAAYAARAAGKRPNFGAIALAAGVAVATAFLAQKARGALAKRLNIPQQAIGVVEDALAIGLVYAAVRGSD